MDPLVHAEERSDDPCRTAIAASRIRGPCAVLLAHRSEFQVYLIDIIDDPPPNRLPLVKGSNSRGRLKVAPYRIVLLSPDDAPREERMIECEHDDVAIDQVGWVDHPHAIDLWQQDRHVVRFPPWPPPSPFLPRGRLRSKA